MNRGPRNALGSRIGPNERAIPISSVLQAAGALAGLRRRGDRLVGPCPIHGGDNPTAFSVDLRLNRWYCFTGCSTGGDVVDLVCRLHRVGLREAAPLLRGMPATLPEFAPSSRTSTPTFRPFRRSIPLNPDCDLLRTKGIWSRTAVPHEVGEYTGNGWLAGCVGVRLHDPIGSPLGYLGRVLRPSHFGRWKLPPGLPKARMLYNYHRASRQEPTVLAVTECPWGVLRLAQIGVPAVALLGVHLSATHADLLSRHAGVVLLLDGDGAGRAAAARIRDALAARIAVNVVRLPDGLDPDDLGDRTLTALMSGFFPL